MREALDRRKARLFAAEAALDGREMASLHGWTVQRTSRGVLEVRWSVPQDALAALRALVTLRQALEVVERSLVETARRQGLDWGSIGWGLGISRQSAHQRHRGVDEELAELSENGL